MQRKHEIFIRKTYALARSAVEKGNHPFGALLVVDGEIILTAENTVNTAHDPTRHAELNLVSRAARQFAAEMLARSTLYTSTEPCAMCTGAIFWTGIPAIVFGCAAETLGQIAGGSLVVPSREILGRGQRPTKVTGPILEAEGAEIHRGFW